MKKIITIEGMTCGHCQARVEKALNALPGVSASVSHKKGEAVVSVSDAVSDEQLMGAVENAGYTAVSLREKKGLFGR